MSLIELDARQCRLRSATALPLAAGYLWNPRMMIHVTARGHATAQFMQPEPASVARAPIMEANHFMLPEQGTYAHHPGRFFYFKDRDSSAVFSAPYEPVRKPLDRFEFRLTPTNIGWSVSESGVDIDIVLNLPVDEALELWEVRIRNGSGRPRRIGFYPVFPLGLMSWMNQSATFDPALNAVVADSVTPYQKVSDYFKNKDLKDKVFLLSEQAPAAYETRQARFEGEGGLHNPDAVTARRLESGDALHENPICALQFDHDLAPGVEAVHRFAFGPAFDRDEIIRLKARFLSEGAFARTRAEYGRYIASGRGNINVDLPDGHLSSFVNSWLPRQVFYHGDTNRLSTDPQTRNLLQDAMGSVYVRPETARAALLKALSQQAPSGAMPDGITLYEGAELKYINQVPHTDHCVWLAILLESYLDETDDYAILDVPVRCGHAGESMTVRERVSKANQWLMSSVDHRNLNFIDQGDWNDPMNMVGWKRRGVSGWLSMATAHSLRLWARILGDDGRDGSAFAAAAERFNAAINTHLWDGDWFGRGITDDGMVFGVKADDEGRIYLNAQSFAILSGAADAGQQEKMVKAVEEHLETPFGVEMLGPAYTHMREDIGRLTQKFPGVAENGSVYNHAAVFYIYSLYQAGRSDKAFALMRKMLAGPEDADYLRRGQLPVFVPNYYRGAWRQLPDAAGRSSHLFNTGTASWLYRSVIEGLLGLRGCRDGLRVAPQLPRHWPGARAVRRFRGAELRVDIRRDRAIDGVTVACNGEPMRDGVVNGIHAGNTYEIAVTVP